MWLSKTAAGRQSDETAVSIGVVTSGGARPCIMTRGESRAAELSACPGVYVPKTGDEVIVCRTADGEIVVLGKLGSAGSAQSGEICIAAPGGGSVVLKSNGDIELTGTVRLVGTTYITGTLVINGQEYVPPAPAV